MVEIVERYIDISEKGHLKVRYTEWGGHPYLYCRHRKRRGTVFADEPIDGKSLIGINQAIGDTGFPHGIGYYDIDKSEELQKVCAVTGLSEGEIKIFKVCADHILNGIEQRELLESQERKEVGELTIQLSELQERYNALELKRTRVVYSANGILARLRGYAKRLNIDVSEVVVAYIRVREAEAAVTAKLQEERRNEHESGS